MDCRLCASKQTAQFIVLVQFLPSDCVIVYVLWRFK